MRVAKLSDGRIVQLLKQAQHVSFSSRKHVLVASQLITRARKIEPFWAKDTAVVWVLNFDNAGSQAEKHGE